MPNIKSSNRYSSWSGNWSFLRDLEVICAVIVERKTTGAAQRLGISQPAVSRAIMKIETRLGRTLFHREAGRLVPTADALSLYERSCHIFDALEQLERPASNELPQRLVILSPPTISHLFLGREVAAFANEHPEITLSLDIVTSQELPSAISEGRGHLGMVDGDFMHSGVVVEPFLDTTAVCLLPEAHALSTKRKITAADLDGVAFVGINRRHSFSNKLDQIFNEARTTPRYVIETDAAMLAIEFVREGLGVTVLNPFPLLLGERTGLLARPFEPKIPFRANFVVPANEPTSAPARKFIDFLKNRRARTVALIAASNPMVPNRPSGISL